ncbi:MAG: FG-GAP-like repeat-containing protein, partial [Phycisphaeraceae bacterium]
YQSKPATLQVDGSYFVRDSQCHSYFGEYRFRVILVPAPWQLESEANNNTGQADPLTFTLEDRVRRGQVTGVLVSGDTAGDFFRLANLGEGTEIRLSQAWPDSSTVDTELAIVDSAGQVVASEGAGIPTLTHTVGEGEEDFYYVRVTGSPHGMFSQWFLSIELEDNTAPWIVADTQPEEGATLTSLFDRFTLTFPEDMDASTINNPSNYDVRAAGPDELFDTADDELYTIETSTSYSSALTASYWVTDGPLQPGDYRITVFPTLADTSGNLLAEPYVRNFSIENIDGFVLENRTSSTREGATTLSLLPPGDFDRSFAPGPLLAMPSNPIHVTVADLNNDGDDDVITVNHGANSISVQLGDGDGAFTSRADYAVGTNPFQAVTGDFDGDGFADVAIVSESPNTVSVFLNNGDGTFAAPDIYPVGSNPRSLAVGDLNGNGILDLVTANRSGHSTSVLLGGQEVEVEAISTDFDDPVDQLDGWTAFGDTGNPRWESEGGNPGGSFAVEDLAQGPVVYFSAPAKFLGDRSSSYGLPLAYDL